MNDEIFVEIMNLIEQKSDIPKTTLNLQNWLEESEQNNKIYEIYTIASKARNF